MKAIEQYFHVVLFIILYKVVLTFKSVDGAVDERPWERGWSTTLALVWPEVMIVDES